MDDGGGQAGESRTIAPAAGSSAGFGRLLRDLRLEPVPAHHGAVVGAFADEVDLILGADLPLQQLALDLGAGDVDRDEHAGRSG